MSAFSEISAKARSRANNLLNAHAQPIPRAFNAQAVADRQIDELIGLIKGILADGEVQQAEAEFLLQWMEANRGVCKTWPASVLFPRLSAALMDGVLDAAEESELMGLLLRTVGGNTAPTSGGTSDATGLPLTDPVPEIEFAGRRFCFTGQFYSGSRDWCMSQIEMRGGVAQPKVTKALHYLVIGELGSEEWRHSTHGRKIETAVRYVGEGLPIGIIGEAHWINALA